MHVRLGPFYVAFLKAPFSVLRAARLPVQISKVNWAGAGGAAIGELPTR